MSRAVPVSEYEDEPIPGLPEVPPEGEEILWQGAPCWRSLARRAFHTHAVAVYFGLLVAWRIGASLSDGQSLAAAVASSGLLVALGATAVGLLAVMAWLAQRATVYTITNRRVVMRVGVALTVAVNFPFRAVRSAGLKTYSDGTGDIPLEVEDAEKVGYVMLWPHVRPWGFGKNVQPMLRAVPDARAVAHLLSRSLAASTQPARRPAAQAAPVESRPRQAAAAAS